jgi:predicted nucleic-acid-binding protein
VIGLDTNVIVRYIVQDDQRQAALATKLFERTLSAEDPGFITCVTLCETTWVLADCYKAEATWKALRAWKGSSADFADALIGQVVAAQGGAKTVTFDRAAAKLAGFELLQ